LTPHQAYYVIMLAPLIPAVVLAVFLVREFLELEE
jgi:hypothetical protein